MTSIIHTALAVIMCFAFITLDHVVSQTPSPVAPIITFDQTVILGDPELFNCTSGRAAVDDPVVTITLIRGGEFLDATTIENGLGVSSSVYITVESVTEIGSTITCRAANGFFELEISANIVDIFLRPTISEIQPSEVSPRSGTTVTFTLDINNAYPAIDSPQWYKDLTLMTFGVTTTQVPNSDGSTGSYSFNSQLQLLVSYLDNNGEDGMDISCSIIHATFPETVTKTITVFVTHEPEPEPGGALEIITNFDNGILESETAEATCTCDGGYLYPNVSWSGGGLTDTTYSRVGVTTVGVVTANTFQFEATVALIGETFVCTCSNSEGTKTLSVILQEVFVIPITLDFTGRSEVNEGEDAIVYTCVSPRAFPSPVLVCSFGGIPQAPTTSPEPTRNNDETFRTEITCTLEQPTATDNDMAVECNMEYASSLTQTSLSESIFITVILKPTVQLSTTSATTDVDVEITTSYQMTCNVVSSRTYSVQWWIVDLSDEPQTTEITPQTGKHQMVQQPGQEVLFVWDFQITDNGYYFCTATNQAGSSPDSNMQTLRCYAIPPIPDLTVDELLPIEGNLVQFDCTSTGGIPYTNMEFYRNADLLDTSYGESGETYITYSHEVHASDMDAEFRCDVFNTHGRRSDTISFQAVYVTPADLTVTGALILYENTAASFDAISSASNPAAVITWELGGVDVTSLAETSDPVPNQEKPGTVDVHSELMFTPQEEDRGKSLICYAHHEWTIPGAPRFQSLDLTIYLIPTVHIADEDIHAEDGTTLTLTCHVDTELEPTVKWFKDGVELDSSGIHHYVMVGRDLIFNPVSLSDQGNYQCRATTAAGTSGFSTAIILFVYIIPSDPLIPVFVNTGIENVLMIINCTSFGGFPTPSLTWSKNNITVDTQSTTASSITYNEYSFFPTLNDIGAIFKCVVQNAYRTIATNRTIDNIYVPLEEPTFQGSLIVYEHSQTQLQCLSPRFRPVPTITWFLGDVDMTSSSNTDFQNNDDGTLAGVSTMTFTPISDDVGKTVSCVFNHPQTMEDDLILLRQLTVFLLPVATLTTPDINVEMGSNKDLLCNVVTELAPEVFWYIGSETITASSHHSMTGTFGETLTIIDFSLPDEGTYSCRARTGAGMSALSDLLTLVLYRKPSKPDVTANNLSPIEGSVVTVYMTSTGGIPNTVLRLYFDDEEVFTISGTTNVTSGTYYRTVLFSDRNKIFRSTATNDFGGNGPTTFSFTVVYVVHAMEAIQGDADVMVDQATFFICRTSFAHPAPNITWALRDGTTDEVVSGQDLSPIENPDGNTVKAQSRFDYDPNLDDTGKTLVCIATQEYTLEVREAELELTVHVPPTIADQSAISKPVGQSATFDPSVTSTLTVLEFAWYNGTGGIILEVDDRYVLDDYRLIILNLVLADDGMYHCVATSDAGYSLQSQVLLTVQTPPSTAMIVSLDDTPFPDNTVTITEHEDFRAKCTVTVNPNDNVDFEWSFTDQSRAVDTYVNDDVIHISAADRTWSGLFFCEASNPLGNTEASVTLDVQFLPEAVSNEQTPVSAQSDTLVILTCLVTANPPPTMYTWTHGTDVWQEVEATTEINMPSGESTYTCVAHNSVGMSVAMEIITTGEGISGVDLGPSLGASTADTSTLQPGIIAAIVLGVIFSLLILIICCIGCKYYQDKKKTDKKIKKTKHKISTVVPDEKMSAFYPTKDPALMFGPSRQSYRGEQRHYPRELPTLSHEFEYSHRGGFDPNTFYLPAPGSEMDDMSVYREAGFRSHRRKMPPMLPPLNPTTHQSYTGEAKRRKAQQKSKKKKRHAERQAAEGMENPAKASDTSPQIVIDDSMPENDATNVLLGDQFRN